MTTFSTLSQDEQAQIAQHVNGRTDFDFLDEKLIARVYVSSVSMMRAHFLDALANDELQLWAASEFDSRASDTQRFMCGMSVMFQRRTAASTVQGATSLANGISSIWEEYCNQMVKDELDVIIEDALALFGGEKAA